MRRDFGALIKVAKKDKYGQTKYKGAPPRPPHGLISDTKARITLDCGAMRQLRTKWP